MIEEYYSNRCLHRRRQMRKVALALALTTGLMSAVVGTAGACTIDGIPSAFANDTRAVVYKQAPTTATYAWWAHFAFPHAFRVGQPVVFKEDDAQVRKLLPLADLRRSWRWGFGDKTSVVGDQAAHVYRRAGKYRVSVAAYFRGYGWETFDSITVAVRRS